MKRSLTFGFLLLYLFGGVFVVVALADETYSFHPTTVREPAVANPTAPVEWNHTTWITHLHPQPATVTRTATGDMYGVTTTGLAFTQHSIPTQDGRVVQQFNLGNYTHFIIDGVIAYDLTALSILMATTPIISEHS